MTAAAFQVGASRSFGGEVQVEVRHPWGVVARQGRYAPSSRLQEVSPQWPQGNEYSLICTERNVRYATQHTQYTQQRQQTQRKNKYRFYACVLAVASAASVASVALKCVCCCVLSCASPFFSCAEKVRKGFTLCALCWKQTWLKGEGIVLLVGAVICLVAANRGSNSLLLRQWMAAVSLAFMPISCHLPVTLCVVVLAHLIFFRICIASPLINALNSNLPLWRTTFSTLLNLLIYVLCLIITLSHVFCTPICCRFQVSAQP